MPTEFENDVRISSDLDKELDQQSQRYYKYARLAAIAEKRKNNANLNISVVEAKRAKQIRNLPVEILQAKYGLDKLTDKSMAIVLSSDKEVLKARKNYNRAIEKWKIYEAAAKSFEQRRKMIEKKVEGRIAGIFATPRQGKKQLNRAININRR